MKEEQLATVEDLCNDIWIRMERINQLLAQSNRENFIQNLPPLFALFRYVAVSVLKLPEHPEGDRLKQSFRENAEDLEDECLIEDGEAEELVLRCEQCEKALEEAVKAAAGEDENSSAVFAMVDTVLGQLECDAPAVRQALGRQIAEFTMSYRMGEGTKLPS